MREIILASVSPYRRQLLDRLGLPYRAIAPSYQEDNPPGADPRELVLRHAAGKARSVVPLAPDALIIGSDQVVAHEGRILGKPRTPERAIQQLHRLRGREHELFTAVAIVNGRAGRMVSHVDVTSIRLRDLTDEEISAYVRRENPVDCAGAYRSEGLGIALFAEERGMDPSAVIGLPLIALTRLLDELGVNVLLDPAAPGAP